MEEAHIVAQLQHPSIVPVFDKGTLPNGSLFFTMSEIKGEEFGALIKEYHDARLEDSPKAPILRRRLLNTFRQVCETMSYAHAQGIVHRDLKPENIMIGAHGEVLVVDWGIAKILHQTEISMAGMEELSSQHDKTRVGQITGTPAYMSPEQSKGMTDEIDARSDIYTLGVILFEILTGTIPNEETRDQLTQSTTEIDVISISVETAQMLKATHTLPPALRFICLKCIQREPELRYQSTEELAKKIRDFLDGAEKRAQALEIFKKAQQAQEESKTLSKESIRREAIAQEILSSLNSWAREEKKWNAWEEEERAQILARQASLKKVESETLFHAAIEQYPELTEAHNALIWGYRNEHKRAEKERDIEKIDQFETRLHHHINTLPEEHKNKQNHLQYIKGLGALTLHTDPSGAIVFIETYQTARRRKIRTNRRLLGTTPLLKVPLPMGSYLLTICKEGYRDTAYPINIHRLEHWDTQAPSNIVSRAIPLLREEQLGPHDLYVPQGYFLAGGDEKAYHGLSKEKKWLKGFVIQRFPVTHSAYLSYLNDLCSLERQEEALERAPRTLGEANDIGYHFSNNKFSLKNTSWQEDWPVFMLRWHDSHAYAQWYAQQTDRRWRLPSDYEWEKAAKGTDGRWFPWGDDFDPSFSCMEFSYQTSVPTSIYDFPIDESPYGVRGMGGNVRDWIGGELIQDVYRVVRGGCWNRNQQHCRASNRLFDDPSDRYDRTGFRLIYPIE
jgi:serine/threonine-protein kinase